MGLQVPLGVDSEISEESTLWAASEGIRPILRELALQKESEVVEGD